MRASSAMTGVRTVIGLDIGGSKTHGIKLVDGSVVEDRIAGSANTQNVSTTTASRNLAGLLKALGADEADEVYVGSGGVDTDADKAALRSLITPHIPRVAVTIVHDTRLILAAAGARTGIAVIAGTGSAVWGIAPDGTEARVGGWGYLLGDEGSGYWLARESVRHALHRANLGLPTDDLSTALLDECGLNSPEELIRLFHGGADRTYWANKSRLVFACAQMGHPESLILIQQAGKSLAEQALQVATRLGIPGPVVLGGGLGVNQAALQESFTTHLAAHGLTEVHVLTTEPVFGVPFLAGKTSASTPEVDYMMMPSTRAHH